jgi:cyclopropane fatty-acyl-phospholipid synthase-like methyltransferase
MMGSIRSDIYGPDTIRISEVIGRKYNNPLGEWPVEKFHAIFESPPAAKEILDVGCGRGQLAIHIARKFNQRICGIEKSEAMSQVALKNISKANLTGMIKIINTDFLNSSIKGSRFDIVVSFDVFSYFDEKDLLFAKLSSMTSPNAVLIFSDYFCTDPKDSETQRLAKRWGISLPGDISYYSRFLRRHGFENHSIEDTTSRYRAHWTEMRRRCIDFEPQLLVAVSDQARKNYLDSIDSILSATRTGKFGHLLCCAKK